MLQSGAETIEEESALNQRRAAHGARSTVIALTKPMVIVLLGAAFALTAQSIFSYDHDMSLYLGLARALSRGEGYVFDGAFNEQVPPGLPVLLAPFALFFPPQNVRAFQYPIIAFGVVALFLTWAWAREADRPLPWLTAIIVGLTPGFYYVSTAVVYSETAFMVASLAVLWWSERATRSPSRVRSGLPLALVAISAIAVPALRTAGIALPIALFISAAHDTLRRHRAKSSAADWRRAALLLGLASIAFVAVWSRVVAARATGRYPGGFAPSYMAHLTLRSAVEPDLGTVGIGGVLLRIPESIVRQGAHVAEIFTGIGWVKPFWFSPVIVLMCALTIIGWYRALRRDQPLAAWYSLVFGGIIAIWPFDEGQRFLVPLVPILASFVIDGAQTAVAFASAASRRQRRLVTLAFLVGGLVALVTLLPWSRSLSRQDWAAILAWPFLAGIWLTLQPLTSRFSPRLVGSVLGTGWLVCFVLGSVYQSGSVARSRFTSSRDDLRSAPVARAIDWLAANATPQAVVMTDYYSAVHLWTGLHAVPLPRTGRTEILSAALRCSHPDFVIVNEPLPDPYVLPDEPSRFGVMKRAGVGRFQLMTKYRGGEIYRFTAERLDCPPMYSRSN